MPNVMHAYRYALHVGPAPGHPDGRAQLVIGPSASSALLELVVTHDSDLDARLTCAADARGERAAALMRRAVAEYVDRPPATACAQPAADISGWQWVLHLDAGVAERALQYAAASECHINVMVNRAVGRLLDAFDLECADQSLSRYVLLPGEEADDFVDDALVRADSALRADVDPAARG